MVKNRRGSGATVDRASDPFGERLNAPDYAQTAANPIWQEERGGSQRAVQVEIPEIGRVTGPMVEEGSPAGVVDQVL